MNKFVTSIPVFKTLNAVYAEVEHEKGFFKIPVLALNAIRDDDGEIYLVPQGVADINFVDSLIDDKNFLGLDDGSFEDDFWRAQAASWRLRQQELEKKEKAKKEAKKIG